MKHVIFPLPSLTIAILTASAILGCADSGHRPEMRDAELATNSQVMGAVFQTLDNPKDLKRWTSIGPFLSEEPPNVVKGEDISCANFFPIGDKWMLLCISHPLGCRYYLGDWDVKADPFVPETMQRMTWPWD